MHKTNGRLPKAMGRPSSGKGPLRNFKFHPMVDGFLTAESGRRNGDNTKCRTGKDMTLYLEQALMVLMRLKAALRDRRMSAAARLMEDWKPSVEK